MSAASMFLADYRAAATERASLGVPALPLSAEQTGALTELLATPPAGEEAFLLDLLSERIPPGVDEAAYVKASWLAAVAKGDTPCPLVSPLQAVELLATDGTPLPVPARDQVTIEVEPTAIGVAIDGLSA